jgi:gas vesicle protein
MEQDITGTSHENDLPGNLPTDIDEPGSAERAADLLREQETGPIPLGPATPGQGEDAVLLVETTSVPDQEGTLTPEDLFLGEMDMEEASPWYRSQWVYLGAGLVVGTALAAGAVLLLRNRRARQQRTMLGRAQNLLSQWSNQLSGQTGRLTGQVSRLAKRSPGTGLNLIPFQRPSGASKWAKQARQQLTNLPQQVGGQFGSIGSQLRSIGSSIGTTARETTTQAIDRTQEGLAHIKEGVSAGAARTGEGIKAGWKFSRSFTIGMATGAVWAAIFAPQSGETTRQHLRSIFPSRWPRKQ